MFIRITRAAARHALILTVLLSVETYAQGPPGPPPPPPGTPQAAGQEIFLTRCASCHGTTGNGGEFAPAITTRIPLRTDDDLIRILHSGLPNSGMPAFADIIDPARANLIAYLRTLRAQGDLNAYPHTLPPQGRTGVTHKTVQIADGGKRSGPVLNRSATGIQLLG